MWGLGSFNRYVTAYEGARLLALRLLYRMKAKKRYNVEEGGVHMSENDTKWCYVTVTLTLMEHYVLAALRTVFKAPLWGGLDSGVTVI